MRRDRMSPIVIYVRIFAPANAAWIWGMIITITTTITTMAMATGIILTIMTIRTITCMQYIHMRNIRSGQNVRGLKCA